MVTWALAAPAGRAFGSGPGWIAAAAAGIAAALAASLLIERFTYRYMRVRHGDATEHALPLVSSLGFLIIFEHLTVALWGSDPHRVELPLRDTDLHFGPLVVGGPHLASLLLALALAALIGAVLERTRLGRALRAIAENPDAATLMGVEVQRIVPVVFAAAGALAALAGILYAASYGTVSPYMGDTIATDAIAGMVIGGLGSVWGAVAGGLLIGMLKVMAISLFGAEIEKIPVWGLLLLVLVVRPAGLFGHRRLGRARF